MIASAPGARGGKREIAWSLTLLSLMLVTLAASATVARGEPPPPGKLIDRGNLDIYAPYMPAALKFAIAHGLKARVAATSRIDWPVGFQQATEKYSGQASLDEHDAIQNYIAGMPFPLISATDPKAAIKIAYNWRWGPFVPDDVAILTTQRFLAWTTADQSTTLIPDDKDRDYRHEEPCDELIFLRYSHRSKVDPRPDFGSDTSIDWKARGNHCASARDISMIWTEQGKPWSISYSVKGLSNVRWLIGSGLGDLPSRKCTYGCTSFWWEYVAPITEFYNWQLSGERPIIACIGASGDAGAISRSGNDAHFDEMPFEVRTAYVLEAVPQKSHMSKFGGLISMDFLRATIYLDSETYVLLGAEFQLFDLTDASVPFWSRRAAAGGGEQLMLSNEFYVPGDRPEFFLSLNLGPGLQKLNAGHLDASTFEFPR